MEIVIKVPELTPEQYSALIRFLHNNISKIVSDDEGFGVLESLLDFEEVGKPQGFDSVLQKLRTTHDLAGKLPDFLTFKLHGDFNQLQFQMNSRKHACYFMVGAERQPSGFSKFVDAYLRLGAVVPYAKNVLRATSAVCPYHDTDKTYWYSRFLYDTEYTEFSPENILEGIKTYDKAIRVLLREKIEEEKGEGVSGGGPG